MRCKGIDLGSDYIEYGKTKGLDLESCHSKKLLSESVKYDLVILNHVLEHLVDIKAELAIIREFFYVAVPGIKNIPDSYGDILKYLQNAHVRHFTRDTLNQIMRFNGFEEIVGDETVRGLYKKGKFDSTTKNYADDVIEYLQKFENAFLTNKFVSKIEWSPLPSKNFDMLNLWVQFLNNGNSVKSYLENIGKNNVAIYGFGLLGKYVYDELKAASNIKVDYLIDRRDLLVDDVKIYKPSSNLPKTGLIIIATSGDYDKIKETLGNSNEISSIKNDKYYKKTTQSYIIEGSAYIILSKK